MKRKLMILLANFYLNLAAIFEIKSAKYYKKATDIHLAYQTPFGKQVQAYMDKTETVLENQQQYVQKTEEQRQEAAMKQHDLQERNKIAFMVHARLQEKEVESKSKETSKPRNNS